MNTKGTRQTRSEWLDFIILEPGAAANCEGNDPVASLNLTKIPGAGRKIARKGGVHYADNQPAHGSLARNRKS
jgi:hypothetical protein